MQPFVHLSWRRTLLAAAVLIFIGIAGARSELQRIAFFATEPPAKSPWELLGPAPLKVFEAAAASVGDRVFVFGGFYNDRIQAARAVWAYDPVADTWSPRKDMPTATTHANAVVLGGLIWFAGGFTGDSPGPATAEVRRYDPGADRWFAGPPLPAPRGGGALVLLDGRLHYIGGFAEDRESSPGDHWVLDPAGKDSTTWKPLAPLPVPRGHLGAYAVGGAIYAVGGCVGHDPYPRDVSLVHRYDPVRDAWTEMASLPEPRSHFEPSSFVRNGRIVLVGGRSRPTGREAVPDITEYDPALNRWRALPPLPEPRHSPIAVLTSRGIVAGLGGRWGSDPNSNAMWRFQSEENPWIRVAPMPVALSEVSAAVVGHRVYVVGVGGPWTLAYDLETGRWDDSARHAVRPARGNHHAAEVWHDRLYLFGGVDWGQGRVQIYDPQTETWRFGPPMPFAAGSSASALIGDQIYVAGGIVGPGTTGLAARFDPAAETWTPIAPMPIPRNHAASATDGKRLFVFGGRGAGSGDSNYIANGFDDVQIYDPATNQWIASRSGASNAPPPLPQPRGGMGKAVYARGEFWVFGGETLDGHGAVRGGVYDRVDIYDPVANRWRSGPAMAVPRHGIFPVLLGDEVFVPGGGLQHGVSSTRVADLLVLPPAR